MYTNVDSFMNKRDELRALIQNKSYDVIALTEILPKNKDQFLFFVCGRSRTRTLGLGFSGFFQFKTTNDSFFSQAGK
jgi:hypothetical protein